jgi:probable HAF family extracellular repeat protein
MHDLGTLGGTYSYGNGINDSGHVTGGSNTTGTTPTHAFLYDGSLHDLGTLGGTDSYGYGINDNGQLTGASFTIGGENHAFVWTPTTTPGGTSGTMFDLGTLGGTFSEGRGINASGQVAGVSYTTGNAATHAFLYTSGSGMVDLNSLINPHLGWELEFAFAINDAGQITGEGHIGGLTRAFLLTPVPEPSTFIIAALGLAVLATANRRWGIRLNRAATPACQTSTLPLNRRNEP